MCSCTKRPIGIGCARKKAPPKRGRCTGCSRKAGFPQHDNSGYRGVVPTKASTSAAFAAPPSWFMHRVACYHFATQLDGTRRNRPVRWRDREGVQGPKTLTKWHAIELGGMARAELRDRGFL